ncbi:MAG: dockerin type I repeat-containing protein [bacterium]
MRKPKTWTRGAASLALAFFLFLASREAAAQFQLRCDGFSAVGGTSSSAGNNLLVAGGQPHPLGTSSSPNFILNPGFIPCLLFARPAECRVTARVDLPPQVMEGRQFTAKIHIDMRDCPAPDDLLGSFSSSLSWNNSLLRFTNHSGILAGFTGVVNTTNANAGMIEFNGSNPSGASSEIKILEVTFEVVGAAGANGTLDLNFSAMAAAGSFTNLLPKLTILDGPFSIIRSACQVCGDVSDDGAANSTDALIALSYDAGITLPPAILDKINAGCGDVNTDGATNSTDALIILSHDAGISVPFPVGNPGGCSGGTVIGVKSANHRRVKTEN